MTVQTEAQTQAKAKAAYLSNYWTLYFRHGVQPNLQKNFYFEGTMDQASARARAHCEIMGYRYIFIKPLVIDIEAEEAYNLGRGSPASTG